MSKTRTALVIGGGIAGPVAALALRKVGIEATVYEAYPPESNGIGGGLGLASNGLAALELVDAADAVRAIATSFPTMYMSINGKRAGVAATLNGEEPLQLVTRGDLHKALHDVADAAGIEFVYGKRLVSADEQPGGITARFADGTSASADILIGADGIKSTVRTLIDPEAPAAKWTGTIGFGSYDIDVADVPDIDIEPNTGCFSFGKRAYYLYWRYPNGTIAWGANLPWKEYLSISEARAVPNEQWIDVFRETYAGDMPGEQMVRALKPEGLDIQGGLHIMPPVPHWYRGRMVLVGDSVHAPSNSSGQGASLAIESAIELARALRDLPDHESAFAAYERLRRTRVEKIAKAAARVNHAKAPGPVAKVLMRAIMPIMFSPKIVEKSNGPALRHRIAFDEPVLAQL
ncbi:MAG TPA: NAD(P)/FAD-dependent oxidoreductase [Actinospica sp.]|jgi:2-polyprenyl-6-methoxyphenol hydroxylase-like FAD-dependent oxidoreductase|nr:NAD(P)/FAD-dependent oxidoreductase [Actinospica sp.]